METTEQRDKRMAWWRDARFGLFIHWGVYAVLAGDWKGKKYGKQHKTPSGALMGSIEWTMKMAEIPVAEYEEVAKTLNPVDFDAAEWVRIAKDAGMKYIAITAKHHDGFSMYHSKVSDYNIVDFTPFDRDPLKELADECAKAGLHLCFYYSQTQDWHHPGGVGNDWDFDPATKDFDGYIDDYVMPQVRELLTDYGPIGVIWFDTPKDMTAEQSDALYHLVTELQPDSVVSGRVGNDRGDYVSYPDRTLPPGKVDVDWESPMTMNLNWGYNKDDHDWKSTSQVIRMVCSGASRGGNVLLNVGPTAEGVIPQPSVDRLAETGEWMSVNSEAIHGSQASPFDDNVAWGAVTMKPGHRPDHRPGRLYLHVFQWLGGELVIHGLQSRVTQATALANPDTPLNFQQRTEGGKDVLRVALPDEAPDPNVSVIALDIDGEIDVARGPLQQPDGCVTLLSHVAKIDGDNPPEIGRWGFVEGWKDTDSSLTWDFTLYDPGKYEIEIQMATHHATGHFETGHSFKIDIADQAIDCVANEDERRSDPFREDGPIPRPDIITKAGKVTIDNSGRQTLSITPTAFADELKMGVQLRSINLVPAI